MHVPHPDVEVRVHVPDSCEGDTLVVATPDFVFDAEPHTLPDFQNLHIELEPIEIPELDFTFEPLEIEIPAFDLKLQPLEALEEIEFEPFDFELVVPEELEEIEVDPEVFEVFEIEELGEPAHQENEAAVVERGPWEPTNPFVTTSLASGSTVAIPLQHAGADDPAELLAELKELVLGMRGELRELRAEVRSLRGDVSAPRGPAAPAPRRGPAAR